MSCLVNPPKPGDASHKLWQKEVADEAASLKRRAKLVTEGFRSLDGVSCNDTEGAMYSFPKVNGYLSVYLSVYFSGTLCTVKSSYCG